MHHTRADWGALCTMSAPPPPSASNTYFTHSDYLLIRQQMRICLALN